MQVRPADLGRQLVAGLAPMYLISGDETLLVQECCDDVIARARADGFNEREIIDADKSYDWRTLREQTGSLSLFSAKRIFDIRVPASQFGREASTALREWLARPLADTLILIRSGRLDAKQRKSVWYKDIEKSGVVVQVWPVAAAELPAWLDQRSRKAGLSLDRRALDFLAARVEGNLLAAVQEIEKLRMLDMPSPMSAEAVRAAVADASHYDSFDAVDAALAQQSRRLHHIVGVLRAEGLAPLAVLGALMSQVHRLQAGFPGGMPPQRARIFERARARLSVADLEQLVHLGAVVDQQVKGMREGDSWQTLETMFLLLAGERGMLGMTRRLDALRRI
jgi:DNA polymerase III subunit delta